MRTGHVGPVVLGLVLQGVALTVDDNAPLEGQLAQPLNLVLHGLQAYARCWMLKKGCPVNVPQAASLRQP